MLMINTPKHLAYILKVDLQEIYTIIQNIDKFYTEVIILKKDKQGLPIIDKNGKP